MLAVEIALAAAGVGIYVGPLHGLVLAMLGLRRTGVLGVPPPAGRRRHGPQYRLVLDGD